MKVKAPCAGTHTTSHPVIAAPVSLLADSLLSCFNLARCRNHQATGHNQPKHHGLRHVLITLPFSPPELIDCACRLQMMDNCLRLVNGQLSQQLRAEQAQPSASADGSAHKAPAQDTALNAVPSGVNVPGDGPQVVHGISVGILRSAAVTSQHSISFLSRCQFV